MTTANNLRLTAMNSHRVRLFGSSSLKCFSTTPEDGETQVAEFNEDWFAHRVHAITTTGIRDYPGAWQFQIAAETDWVTSQDFMLAIVALTVADDRWKVSKVEKPIGTSLVWKIKAEKQ